MQYVFTNQEKGPCPNFRSFILPVRLGASLLLYAPVLLSLRVSLAQTPLQLTVDQAIDETIDNNLNLLAGRYKLAIADAQVVTTRLQPNLVLSVDAVGESPRERQTFTVEGPRTQAKEVKP